MITRRYRMKLRKPMSLFLATAITVGSLIFFSNAVVTSDDYTAEELDCPDYDVRKYTDAFWEGNIVYNEVVHPIRDSSNNLVPFELMYDASEIVSVKDYKLKVTYTEGKDYKLEDGNLVILPGGSIHVMDYDDIHMNSVPSDYGKDEIFPYYPHADTPNTWEYWTGGSDICKYSLAVTYIHNDTWDAPVPESQEANLPGTFDKLKNKEPLTIVVAGDSVSTGAMGSGFLGISPYAEAYPEMTASALRKKYNNDNIQLINSAIGGTMSYFEETKMNNTIIAYSPDLVILNFGMNDSSCGRVGIPGQEFHDNLALQIEYIKQKLPECEVLLVSSLYGNRLTFPAERYEEHAGVLYDLVEEYDGVGVADPQRIEKYLIEETGKDYLCFTADNMVHPGDLGMRLSAQAILEALSFEDLQSYNDHLINKMTEYAYEKNSDANKEQEILDYIASVEDSLFGLTDEWDVTAVVDAAYEGLDKIILRCDVHTYEDNVVPPTCKEGGYTYSVCKICKDEYTHSYTAPLGGEHIMDSGRITQNPSYLAPGSKTYFCAKCTYSESEPIAKLSNPPTMYNEGMVHFSNAHNYMASNIQPYTQNRGYVEFDFCPLDIERFGGTPYVGVWFCGYGVTACYNFAKQEVQIVETSLPFGGGTVHASVPYDWSSDGGEYEYNWKKFAVRLGGTTVQIYINGELVLEDTKSFYRASSEVALIYSNGECYMDNVKVAIGNYDPTTGTGGTVLGSCDFNSQEAYNNFFSSWDQQYAVRNFVNPNAITATNAQYKHTHSGSVVNVVEPGCGFEGYTEYQCDMCRAVYKDNFTDPTHESHSLTNKTLAAKPNAFDDGEYTYTCENCDFTFTEVIPKGTKIEYDDDSEVIKGDLNGDGSVTMVDVSIMSRLVRGCTIDASMKAADFNGDGSITNVDYSQLVIFIKTNN